MGTRTSLVRGYEKQVAEEAAMSAATADASAAAPTSVEIDVHPPAELLRGESVSLAASPVEHVLESGSRLPLFVSAVCGPIVKIDMHRGIAGIRSGVDIAENPEQAMRSAIEAR